MPSTTPRPITVADIELPAAGLDIQRAAAIYREHGCLVVRGLFDRYVSGIHRDIEEAATQAIALLPKARKIAEGWDTPDGTLFLPAPAHFARAQQIMVLNCNYRMSANIFRSAIDDTLCDLAAAVLGPDVELFMDGQVLYKEPVGGHPKHLHQDAAYFEHRLDGPMAVLNYIVDTDLTNGALHVIPGSHRMGLLPHVDTFSHLGLDEREWPWERALPVVGKAGDAIFFHVLTIHGSKENFSTTPRPVCIHRYRSAYDYTVAEGTSVANRTSAQAEAERAAILARRARQRGMMVRGFRRHQADDEVGSPWQR